MTAHYQAWLEALVNRDNTLVQLGIIAVSLVGAWVSLRWPIFQPIRPQLQKVFMAAGLVLFFFWLYKAISGG